MPELACHDDVYDAITGADAMVILTEWNSYRTLDLKRVMGLLATPTIIDLRNIYRPEEMTELGFHYVSIGRPYAQQIARQAAAQVREIAAS